nr:ribosomal protein S18-alanine N-acetyltransferase [uncultured Undibacterium sp.]
MQNSIPLQPNSQKHYYCQLGVNDLDEILAIEDAVYSHPWTRGNFLDSFANPFEALGIRGQDDALIAYFFLMPILEELHLLTFAVNSSYQGQGYAKLLLEQMMALAIRKKYLSIMLEVRISNVRAQAIYKRFGFVEIGRRKAYYPVDQFTREDAIVMRIALSDINSHG